MADKPEDISQMSILQLLGLLRPGQLWGTLAAIVGLIVGAFTLGNYMSQHKLSVAEEKIKLHNQRVEELKSQLGKMEAKSVQADTKQEFLIRYLRYMTYKEMLEEDFSSETQAKFEQVENMFVDLIAGWWKRQNEFNGTLVLNPAVIRKGLDPTNSRVSFPDGSGWPIPTDIKQKVLAR
jgi:hypothetical protein